MLGTLKCGAPRRCKPISLSSGRISRHRSATRIWYAREYGRRSRAWERKSRRVRAGLPGLTPAFSFSHRVGFDYNYILSRSRPSKQHDPSLLLVYTCFLDAVTLRCQALDRGAGTLHGRIFPTEFPADCFVIQTSPYFSRMGHCRSIYWSYCDGS